MPQKVNPKREEAKALFLNKKGKITPKEIAAQLGISAKSVRSWKYRDKWESQLPKRGAKKGNQNAAGNSGGAPEGNTNAETHGAYSIPRVNAWPQEEREWLDAISPEFSPLAEQQLKRLLAKQHDLERRIAELSGDDGQSGGHSENSEPLYLDRIMTMQLPDGGEMKYRSESSAFSRRMTLEAELNRVQGRVQKLLDSIRAREDSEQRFRFEQEKFSFARQKALGEFLVDEYGELETGTEDREADEVVE